MKLSNSAIEEVISQIAGDEVLPLCRVLKNKKNVSEFKLAEKIDQEINTTRNYLYRLYHANLVSYTRKKDKKKGWYIYYWTFKIKRVAFLGLQIKKEKLEKLLERLKKEQMTQFFACQNECLRLNFEQSINFEFKCPECGELMNQQDNATKIKELEKQIKDLQKELKE